MGRPLGGRQPGTVRELGSLHYGWCDGTTCVCAKSRQSCPTLCDPMSLGSSRQEYWSGWVAMPSWGGGIFPTQSLPLVPPGKPDGTIAKGKPGQVSSPWEPRRSCSLIQKALASRGHKQQEGLYFQKIPLATQLGESNKGCPVRGVDGTIQVQMTAQMWQRYAWVAWMEGERTDPGDGPTGEVREQEVSG